ncbi:hypothetical protein G9A89_009911 [Geosiphon pyriformis]|nr:hypothetical protein G9A89_009911 [Geosiphon pyriformis]
MEDKSLTAIFSFELKELVEMLLFSKAALESKLITAIYTNAKFDGQHIKLILDNRSTSSIITKQLINQLGYQVNCAASAQIITADNTTKIFISKIDDFSFEVNGIITFIKVLVELELYPIKITEHELTITASCATENNMAIQNNKASKTMNHVSLVRSNYLMKKYEMTFLDKRECVTFCVNTQSLSTTE